MNSNRFLERIDDYCDSNIRLSEFNEANLIDSITRHIRSMLNVRQGSVIIRDDYGIADINDITSNYRESMLLIRDSIHNCIKKFEPRLCNVIVQYVDNKDSPLELRFDITGDISMGKKSRKVWFETIMNSAGRVSVR